MMKKWTCCILAAALLLSLATVAYAAEATGCTVTADSVTAGAGETVSVSVKVTGNPGFTNFGISLQYDTEKLTLTKVEAVAGDVSATNLAKDDTKDCYVTSASATAVTGDVVLFTAIFTTAENFTGSANVTPVVSYIRNNAAVFSVFETITATTVSGAVDAGTDVLLGDVNGDSTVDFDDVQLLYKAVIGTSAMSTNQSKAADVNSDGTVDFDDLQLVYKYAIGMIETFSAG